MYNSTVAPLFITTIDSLSLPANSNASLHQRFNDRQKILKIKQFQDSSYKIFLLPFFLLSLKFKKTHTLIYRKQHTWGTWY